MDRTRPHPRRGASEDVSYGRSGHESEGLRRRSHSVTAGRPPTPDDEVGYSGWHLRARKAWGRPRTCEHCQSTTEKRYEWAHVHDAPWSTIRTDWLRLCATCHHLYDVTPEWVKANSEAHKGKILPEEQKAKIRAYRLTAAQRKALSEGQKRRWADPEARQEMSEKQKARLPKAVKIHLRPFERSSS